MFIVRFFNSRLCVWIVGIAESSQPYELHKAPLYWILDTDKGMLYLYSDVIINLKRISKMFNLFNFKKVEYTFWAILIIIDIILPLKLKD